MASIGDVLAARLAQSRSPVPASAPAPVPMSGGPRPVVRPTATTVVQNLSQRPTVRQQMAPTRPMGNTVTAAAAVANLMRQAQQPAIPVNRMGNVARPLTAMQESQLFDQTMQGIHVRQGQLSPVLPGVIMQDPVADARVQAIERQRAQMLRQFQRPAPFVRPAPTQRERLTSFAGSAFPQMTQDELNNRTNEQLQAMVKLGDQQKASVLSGNKTGSQFAPNGPTEHTSQEGPKDNGGGGFMDFLGNLAGAAQDEASTLMGNVTGDAVSFANTLNNVLKDPKDAAGDAAAAVLPTVKDAEQAVGNVLTGAWTGAKNAVDDPGKTAGYLADRFGEAGHIVGAIGSTFLPGPANAYHGVQQLKYELTQSPEAQQLIASHPLVAKFLNGLNKPYEWNTTWSGDVWGRTATGDFNHTFNQPLIDEAEWAIASLVFAADPSLKEGVADAFQNGYTSPYYAAAMEAAGITDYPPQFGPGGQAVHEYLIGHTDNLPGPIRDALRLTEGVVMDPLTWLPVAGAIGASTKETGAALATAADATFATKVAGRGAQVAGALVEYGSRLPDTPFELAGWGWNHNPFGTKTPGAFELSADQVARDAETAGVHHGTTVAQAANNGWGPNNPFAGPAAPTGGITPGSTVPPGGAPTGAATAAIPSMPGAAPGSTVPPGGAPTGGAAAPTAPTSPVTGTMTYAPPSANGTPLVRIPPAPADAPPVLWHTSTNSAGATTHTAYIGDTGNVRVIQRGQTVITQQINPDTGEWATTGSQTVSTRGAAPLQAAQELDQAFSDAIHEARISYVAPVASSEPPAGPPPNKPKIDEPDDEAPVTTSANNGNPPVIRHQTPPRPGADETRIESLVPPVSPDKIPGDFPEVKTAVERGLAGTKVDTTGNIPGESAFTPVYGGSGPQDVAVTRAVASGDLRAISDANELAQQIAPLADTLNSAPEYRGFHAPMTRGGVTVNGTVLIEGMSPDQIRALRQMQSSTGGTVAAPYRMANLTKEVLEKAAELKFLGDTYSPLHREIMGYPLVNTEADQMFGFTWTPMDTTKFPLKPKAGVQRIEYLMDRFVTTSSDEYAQMLRDWFNKVPGPEVLNIKDGPKPYLTNIPALPGELRQQVIDMLEEARAAYRASAAALTPEEAAAWEARKAPGIKPTSATQMEGGLKGSTKKAAKDYNGWVKANEPKRAAPEAAPPASAAPAWSKDDTLSRLRAEKKTAEDAKDWAAATALDTRIMHVEEGVPLPGDGPPSSSALGIKFDPMGDAEAKVNSALDQAQRPADDTAYRDENGDPPKNPMLQQLNEAAAPGFDNKATAYLNTTIDWKPPKRLNAQEPWYPQEWTTFDAMLWAYNEKVRNPAFDYWGTLDEIAAAQAGLPPKMTPAEKKAAIKVYKDRGEVVPEYLTKSDRVQRLESTRAIRLYDKYLNQVRQASLFGPIGGFAGYIGDVIGNFWAQIVNGHFGPAFEGINPIKNIGAVKGFRETQRAVESVNPFMMQNAADAYVTFQRNAHQTADAMLEPILRETGQVIPQDLYAAGTVREVKVSGKPDVNALVEGRNPVIRGAANLWTVPGIKDLRTSTDLLNRTSLFKSVYKDSLYHDALPAFRKKLGEKVGKANVDAVIKDTLKAAEARAQSANVKWNGMFSPEDVKTALNGKPYADDMARAWQGETNLSVAKAYNEQKRVFFSYKNTNADELVGSVMMFHYWQTRASYMHLRAALRHPVLLNGYYKLWQELKDRTEAGGVGYLGPMYKFMTSPSGIYAAVDPLGLLIPTTIMDMSDQEGSKFRVLQNQLNPVVGAVLAVAGVTDNVPNMTGFRTTERWLINMGNFLVAEGVDVSSVPILNKVWDNNTMRLNMPIDEAVKTILQDINGWAESKGIPVGDFKPFDRGANEMDQLNTWVIKGVEQQYGPQETWEPDGPAWQALDDALDALTTGASNPIADEAEKNYAQEGFIAAMAAPVVPGGVITRSGYRDEQIAGNKTGDQGASDNRDIATSADPTWTTMHQQWNRIGTPEEQAVYDQWIALTYGDMNTPVLAHTSGGLVVIPKSYIQNMSDEEREDFTNRWVAQNPGYSETIQKIQSARDAFKLAHPQMSEFKEYQKAAYNEDTGGVRAFRTSLAKTNPNFANELKKQREMLEGFGYKGEELERRLDGWAAGKDGYLAAMGLPIKNGDKPLPVYDPSKNPYENPAMAGMAPQPGGGSSGTGEGSKSITKGPDGKLYDKDGNLVNASGKRINEQGQVIDSYWYPDEVAQRYAQQQAKYDDANKQMESQFGPYWNDQTGEWEASADSSSERKKLSYNGRTLSDIPYNKPEKGQLMQDYEAWADVNGGGSLEDWFNYLMSTPGYGVQADPATTIGYGAKPSTPSAPTRATSIGGALEQRLNQAGMSLSAPPSKPAKSSGQVTGTNVSSIDGYQISQQYGMTDFAATQIGPGGMYDYTIDYTTDGSAVGHMGIDVALPDHTELYAPVSGTVVQAGGMPFEMDDRYQQAPGTGGLRIQLDNGDIVVMAHMQQIDVNVGDRVELGQPVGYSGIANGGAHVHVEYRQYAPGQTASGYLAVNPLTMLDMSAVQ